MLRIEYLREYLNDETIVLTEHVLSRMRQRHIRFADIKHTIKNGEIIEQYPTDYPFPSCLINGENIHIVCSVGENRLYIITAYRPSLDKWEDGGRKRKENKP
ncbi:MAG: DUF4258 domain-containing protein [Spirochaetaceae bacterium]|nr:DUF4258 domain-containing protein [Spirochaetaceae bacterium]